MDVGQRTPVVPWWAVLSATLAPVFLVGGWTVAAALQPAGYDPVRDTISELAGRGAADRWVMEAGIVALGVCHVVTAYGLLPAARAGRTVLAAGATATVLVAAFPVPAAGPAEGHGLLAGVGFVCIAVWPAAAWRYGSPAWGLRKTVSLTAAVVLFTFVAVFAIQLYGIVGDGRHIGVAERTAAAAEALWPVIVVVSCRWQAAGARVRQRSPEPASSDD